MKKKELSKTFSVRADISDIVDFEKLAEKNQTNKNKLINDFMLDYILQHIGHYEGTNTDLHNNIDILGYKKDFFTKEDAEFYIQAQHVIEPEEDWLLDESNFFRVLHTGVKYSFTNIGLVVYSTWFFSQSKEAGTGRLTLDFTPASILYDANDDSVQYMDNMDHTEFYLKEDIELK